MFALRLPPVALIVSETLDRAWDALLVRTIAHLPNVAAALLVFIFGWLLARILRRSLSRLFDRGDIGQNSLLRDFFLRTLYAVLLALTILTALSQLNINVQTFIAGLGITGIIIGFGLRDTLSNFAAGLLLLIYRPFRAGELIEVEGTQGVVEVLSIVNMQMKTTEGFRVIMPNSRVWGARITNFSQSEQRRAEIVLKVRDEDLHQAIAAVQDALATSPQVLESPAPSIRVTALAGGAATLTVRAWTSPADFESATSNLYLEIQAALERIDITLL